MKTWKELGAVAKRQGMSLNIRPNVVVIDGNKGTNELFAVSCNVVSKKDLILRLCVEASLKELKDKELEGQVASPVMPSEAGRGAGSRLARRGVPKS
jgi:hypothetical protein